MRKVLLSLVAIAAAVFATSCTNDLLDEGVKGGNRVTFNISTPELATRAFGDGTTATDLYYAVYEGDTILNDISVTPGETPVKLQEGKTSIMLDLASGIEYNLIFWAAAPDAIGTLYNVDFANKSMSLIEPDKFVSQNENLDAFYAYVPNVVAGNDKEVKLYRPFAQLNISVSDADILAAKNANLNVGKTQVSVEGAYTKLNLTDGTVSEPADYNFALAAAPKVANTPKAGYTLYSMNYLLVDNTKTLVDVKFGYTRAEDSTDAIVNEREFGNVPVQRNYRTNIYGDLLTKSTGFEVEIKEGWKDYEYDSEAIYVIDANGEFHKYSTLQDAIANALSGETIQLPEGNWELPSSISVSIGSRANEVTALTFAGEENTVVTFKGGVLTAENMDITFSNLTYKTANNGYKNAVHHANKVTFNECSIIGQFYCQSNAPHFFNNCTIDPLNGYLYTYASDVEFKGCTFNASEGKALQVYEDASTGENNVLIENCTFKAAKEAMTSSTPAQPVTAIDINSNGAKFNVVVNNCTAEGFGTGKTSGSKLWNIKGGHKNINLTIDGEVVWTAGAEFVAIGVTKVEGVYHINSLDGLKWLAAEVNGGNTFSGKTVVLDADINLASEEWTPIGNSTNKFQGKFDGQNHTIKNLVVTGYNDYAGLFGYSSGGNTIKNLIVENANVTGDGYLGAVVGCAFTTSFNNVTIKGDVYVEGTGQDIGALTGYTYGTLTDITVNANEGSYVKGESYFGGVVGYRGEGDITYTRVKSNIDVTGKYYMIGGITGIAQYGNKFVDCECSGNVSLTDGDPNSTNRWMRIGGIAGSWMDGDDSYVVTLENCSFTGKLSSKNTNGDYVKEFDNNGYVGRSYNTSNKGKLIIDGQWITSAADAAELNTKVSEGNAVISLPAGEYTFPKAFGENVTIVCEEGTVFTGNSKLNINGATVVGATFSNPTGNAVSGTINGTLKNCTFDGSNGLRGCYAGETVVFENCVFSGDVYGAHFDGGANDVVFRNCTFSGFNAMGSAITKLTLEGCTFKAGRSGYNGINMWGDTEMKECEFTFNSNGEKTEWVDAVGNDKTYKFVGCTVNGVPITAEQIGDYGTGNTIIVE